MSTESARSSDREIVSTRLLPAASRAAVVRAFTDSAQPARGWGPAGSTSTFHPFGLRPGGAWRLVMRRPAVAEYPLTKECVEVAPPDRVFLRQVGGGHQFRMAMSFAEEGGGTRVTWRMRFDSPAEGCGCGGFVAAANEENFDRLAALLAAEAQSPTLALAREPATCRRPRPQADARPVPVPTFL